MLLISILQLLYLLLLLDFRLANPGPMKISFRVKFLSLSSVECFPTVCPLGLFSVALMDAYEYFGRWATRSESGGNRYSVYLLSFYCHR